MAVRPRVSVRHRPLKGASRCGDYPSTGEREEQSAKARGSTGWIMTEPIKTIHNMSKATGQMYRWKRNR